MPGFNFSDRLVDPKSKDRRPRRAAYALPTLFTAGNILLGFLSIMRAIDGAMAAQTGLASASPHFEFAAKAIGLAGLLDGLDGRIARMTNTTSEFGREMDSLADVITFGLAPAVLAFAFGFRFIDGSFAGVIREHLLRAGYVVSFLYLLCCAARLARFNVQVNPKPKNPGRADRKYFVGLPTPAAAAMVAAVVYAADSTPIRNAPLSIAWLLLLALLSFLMVSTWRYRSFKDLNLLRPRTPLTVILFGILILLVWNYSQPALLGMATLYTGSGIAVRIGGLVRRRFRHDRTPHPERQPG